MSGDCKGVFLYEHHLEEEAGVFDEAVPVGGECARKPACKCLALHQDHLMSGLPLPVACSEHLLPGSVHRKEGHPITAAMSSSICLSVYREIWYLAAGAGVAAPEDTKRGP